MFSRCFRHFLDILSKNLSKSQFHLINLFYNNFDARILHSVGMVQHLLLNSNHIHKTLPSTITNYPSQVRHRDYCSHRTSSFHLGNHVEVSNVFVYVTNFSIWHCYPVLQCALAKRETWVNSFTFSCHKMGNVMMTFWRF